MWAALSSSHRPDLTCFHAQLQLQLHACSVAVSSVRCRRMESPD